jgi:hypothetical protein
MTNNNRPVGLYARYLEAVAAKRKASGDPGWEPFPPEYWRDWEAEHTAASKHDELKDLAEDRRGSAGNGKNGG